MTTPGKRWRVLLMNGDERIEHKNEGIFDELVVDDWSRLERMDSGHWWIKVADITLDVRVSKTGAANVLVHDDGEESTDVSHPGEPEPPSATTHPQEPSLLHAQQKLGAAKGKVNMSIVLRSDCPRSRAGSRGPRLRDGHTRPGAAAGCER